MSDRWDRHFLDMAALVARMSKDPSSKVGAVAVRDRRILATGFNGFPAGMADDRRLLRREEKYPRIVHAEQNVIAWAAREGVPLAGATLYVEPFHPCPDCAKMIVQAGFADVVHGSGEVPERWIEHFALAAETLREGGVRVRGA
jgi:dCMP deaminase